MVLGGHKAASHLLGALGDAGLEMARLISREIEMSGAKIIEGLKQAIAGDFARVTIEGQTWVRVSSTRKCGACGDTKIDPKLHDTQSRDDQ
jgi:hypothetical protein